MATPDKEKVKNPTYIARREREQSEKDGESYKGCWYRVGFQINTQIKLTGLVFYGPSGVKVADYLVRYEIVRERNKYNRATMCCVGPAYKEEVILRSQKFLAKGIPKGTKFTVPLPEVRVTPADGWIFIKFELIGPKTSFMKKKREDDMHVTVDGSKTPVTFAFLSGSKQLPELHFVVD